MFAAALTPETQLIEAVKSGDIATVRTLVARKVDINAPGADSSTALHWAVQKNNLELTDLLIGAGANVHAVTRYKITPLSIAATNGNAPILEHLLKAGVDPNGVSEEGETALMSASLNGNVDAVKTLIKAGAKINVTEPYRGQTAFMQKPQAGGYAGAAAMLGRVRRGREGEVEGYRLHSASSARSIERPDRRRQNAARSRREHRRQNPRFQPPTLKRRWSPCRQRFPLPTSASVLLDYKANPNAEDPRGSALPSRLVWMQFGAS